MAGIDRKFAVWEYRTDDGREYDGIEIRYKQRVENDANSPVTWYCYYSHKDVSFRLESLSLEELREKIAQHLESFNQLDWEPWLLVAVKEAEGNDYVPGASHDLESTMKDGLRVQVHPVERAWGKDGRPFWRKTDQRGRKRWYIREGVPLAEKTLGQEANEYAYQLLKDTPEVRVRLGAVVNALGQARRKLAELFNAEDAAERLLALKSMPLLTAPKKEKDDGS